MRIILACERSGGHVFPALALANKIKDESKKQDKSREVIFFVTSASLKEYIKKDNFLVLGAVLPFRNIVIEGLFRMFEAARLIISLRPERIIGFGGRDSFFLVLFGSLLGIDTRIYELNVRFGKANRILRIFARKVLCAFRPATMNRKTVVSGIPLRKNIIKIDREAARRTLNFEDKPVIFCLGGSQGASFINNIFLQLVSGREEDFQIIHLTGKRDYFKIVQLYNKINKKGLVKAFDYSTEIFYSAATLVISRAGASTLGEIAFYRVPSILIPYPGAGGHQEQNALYFKRRNAAAVFFEGGFSFTQFALTVKDFLYDRKKRGEIKDNLAKIKLAVSYDRFAVCE
ncbi:MAG: UDP-N-acetylglucosamine--N-acetylmuramyl-(pentapeptide) pyrophosphoryl-undecaprenol N-acetylglucosamine transferase [Candidatus Omnitrophota bacterium]